MSVEFPVPESWRFFEAGSAATLAIRIDNKNRLSILQGTKGNDDYTFRRIEQVQRNLCANAFRTRDLVVLQNNALQNR
jgi:hypothetical protein